MTWPAPWLSLRAYRLRAPCGCRYNLTGGDTVAVSKWRMQRCFRHMKSNSDEVRADVRREIGLNA